MTAPNLTTRELAAHGRRIDEIRAEITAIRNDLPGETADVLHLALIQLENARELVASEVGRRILREPETA